MRRILFAVLYTALALGANPGSADVAALEALRDGTLKKLVFLTGPAPVSQTAFTDENGAEHALADFRGSILLVNFWATWCAPCRAEMPSLDALQGEFGGPDFQVVTIATGRNPPAAIRRFFDESGVTRLPKYLDPKQALARSMAVLGLPVSVILDREGREIARLRGDAKWDSDSARAIVAALLAGAADS